MDEAAVVQARLQKITKMTRDQAVVEKTLNYLHHEDQNAYTCFASLSVPLIVLHFITRLV